MANSIKVLFWLRKNKANKEGLVPLQIRITFQGVRVDKATGHYVHPLQWNSQKQRLKGSKGVTDDINKMLDDLMAKISVVSRGEDNSSNIHLPSIMEQLFATSTEEPTLLGLINEHNIKLKERVGKDVAFSTYEKYIFTYKKVKAFVEQSLGKKDILLRNLNMKFIMDFDHFIRVHDNNQHNTAVKYCINLKRIINVAVMESRLEKSPFHGFKTVYKNTAQVYLSQAELTSIVIQELVKQQHLLVRDLFLFQCYTGLAYTDMINLKLSDISVDNNNARWIVKARQKTGITSIIPLMQPALDIIQKYSSSPERLFPGYSIQKYNQYIGEVGNLAGIPAKLSSHVGRRTFGNIALAKGISLNVISKILGHSSTLITQKIYAITTQNIISNEMQKW